MTRFTKTPEYWAGWILGYYQWAYNASFASIQAKLTFQKLLDLYPALHEADKQKAAEVLHEKIISKPYTTKLQTYRKNCGLSQSDLSALSGVPLRSIQMYEQRNKDINKAHAETLLALSKTLCRPIEDFFEN